MCKTLSEHRVISSLFNVVIQTQRKMDTPWSTLSEHRVISSLFNVAIETQRQMEASPSATQLEHRVISSLFNVVIETQRQMDPTWSTLSEHRVITSLFNVVIQTQRHMDPLCAKHCQSTEWSLHCSMLSFRFKGRWTPPSTLSENRVISSMFNVVIQTQRQMDTLHVQNTVRAQSDLFTVQCCHSDSKADGPPPMCKTLPERRVISSLFNVVIETQRQMDSTHKSNTLRPQSYLFTVQCCHLDSKADGPPMCKHCQSTEWSLHCSMLSFRLKGRVDPPGQHCLSTEWSLHSSI